MCVRGGRGGGGGVISLEYHRRSVAILQSIIKSLHYTLNSLSRTLSEPVDGRRALYGYPCPEDRFHDSREIYNNSDGMLYVK